MRALIWKDYRMNRAPLLVALLLWLVPFALQAMEALHLSWPAWPRGESWARHLSTAACIGLFLTAISMAILGGNSIACERADRSAEFLACLPPSRRKVLASKALLALAAGLAIWTVNLTVLLVLAPALAGQPLPLPAGISLPPLAASTVFLFCAGWLGSALLESAAFATCIGFALPFLCGMLLALASTFLGWPPRGGLEAATTAMCLVLGPVCFLSGSAYLLRRAEP